jgi:NAD(P)H dehydrogenase (quinone)
MAKKIVVINGHPNRGSLNFKLADAYKKGAESSGAEIKEIVITDLAFNPNLRFGYQKRTELEQDLLDAWKKIIWAEHLVWVHPVWWGGLPALTKGFIDRLFLPGFSFRYRVLPGQTRISRHPRRQLIARGSSIRAAQPPSSMWMSP